MRLKILPGGVMGSDPVIMDATLVLVEMEDGTPVMVCGEYGPDGAVRASHAGDDDFNKTLNSLGINRTVICDTIVLPPPPPGARLLKGKP